MKNKDWLVEAHKNREKAVALANRLEGVDKEYNRPKKKEKKSKKWAVIFWLFVFVLLFIYGVNCFLSGEIRFFNFYYKLPNTYNPVTDNELPIEKLIDNWIDDGNLQRSLKTDCESIMICYSYDVKSGTYYGSDCISKNSDGKTCFFQGKRSYNEEREGTYTIDVWNAFVDVLTTSKIEVYDKTKVHDENGKLIDEVIDKAVIIEDSQHEKAYLIMTPENIDEISKKFMELYKTADIVE